MRRFLAVLAWLAVVPVAAAAQSKVEFLTPYGPPTNPFSPAVRTGNLLFVAGQIGTPDSKAAAVVPGGIGPETRQAMLNIKEILEKSGSDMAHVVKCTVFIADMKEWGAMNAVYRTFFTDGRYPARSALGANGLALNARVEIECIAAAK